MPFDIVSPGGKDLNDFFIRFRGPTRDDLSAMWNSGVDDPLRRRALWQFLKWWDCQAVAVYRDDATAKGASRWIWEKRRLGAPEQFPPCLPWMVEHSCPAWMEGASVGQSSWYPVGAAIPSPVLPIHPPIFLRNRYDKSAEPQHQKTLPDAGCRPLKTMLEVASKMSVVTSVDIIDAYGLHQDTAPVLRWLAGLKWTGAVNLLFLDLEVDWEVLGDLPRTFVARAVTKKSFPFHDRFVLLRGHVDPKDKPAVVAGLMMGHGLKALGGGGGATTVVRLASATLQDLATDVDRAVGLTAKTCQRGRK